MTSLQEIRDVRLKKLERLKELGINPYPAISHRTHTIQDITALFPEFEMDAESLPPCTEDFSSLRTVTLSGRVMSIRAQGALTFFNLFDGTGTFQALYKIAKEKESIEHSFLKKFELFSEVVDIGDFVEVTGVLFKTKTGQQTMLVSNWMMLTKTLLPLPEKWHGLQDVDERYRKRYLDILSNPELREMFELKAQFWQRIRNFMLDHQFIEVETPTLEVTTGGAEANPFKTHHRDFDLPVYLRISVGELWQKRLMSAGFPRTFEIGRVYRNEGSSPEHVQEFTNLEFYAAYMDYTEGIRFTEEMLKYAIRETFGKMKFSSRGHEFDLDQPWTMLDYVSTVKDMTGVDVLKASEDEMKAKLEELGVQYTGENRERLTDTLWKYCRKQISGPAWLINHPKLVSPLSKAKIDNPELTERVQLILAGAEVTNGFSELNDPLDQRSRFELQKKLIESGDEEAMMPEWEFVDMLEHGMPPTFGFGFGERFFAFLVDKPIRETQLFPLMRPLEHGEGEDEESAKELKKLRKEQKVAVIVLNKESALVPWQRMNTVAHLSASFGARTEKELHLQSKIKTADQKDIHLNIQHAILIKEVEHGKDLKHLLEDAIVQIKHTQGEVEVSEFTREMLLTTNDKKVIEQTKQKNHADVEHLGILVFGPKSLVEKITSSAVLAE